MSIKMLMYFLFFISVPVISFSENQNPDPSVNPDFYANKWLVITSTSSDSSTLTCSNGSILATSNYDSLKGGLYICVQACLKTKADALKESNALKKKGFDNYIRHTGMYKHRKNADCQKVVWNQVSDSLFNTFSRFSRAKVVQVHAKTKQNISGDYFGLDKTLQISASDSVIDELYDTISRGDFTCDFFCPPTYRKYIKNKENLYCAIPSGQNRLLLIYFYKNWLTAPFNDSTYYVIQECGELSSAVDTVYIQEKASEIPGPIRMHDLGNDYLLLERTGYRQTCEGELIQFTVFDKKMHHIETINVMSTFPAVYLRGPRPVKRGSVPDDVVASMNESMCYVIDSFYAANYNGKHAILCYTDFKISDVLLWTGTSFERKKE